MMNRLVLIIAVITIACVLSPCSGFTVNTDAIVALKKAGISDATLELIIAERTIETAAYSVEELVALKKAGIGEKTLQAIVRAGSFLKEREPIIYGRAIRPIRLSSVEDIIEMQRAGFSDEVLEAVLSVADPNTDEDRERALDLLERMKIRVDLRGN